MGFEGEEIRIKYFDKDMPKLEQKEGSDWIDLRSIEDINLEKGESTMVPLGVAMQLPKGYEAYIIPRSSSFKNFGFIQTNHVGLIDESYCGDNDQWKLPIYAVRDVHIKKYDRICQFRINKKQEHIHFEVVDELGNEDRNGFGSTGRD